MRMHIGEEEEKNLTATAQPQGQEEGLGLKAAGRPMSSSVRGGQSEDVPLDLLLQPFSGLGNNDSRSVSRAANCASSSLSKESQVVNNHSYCSQASC